jgi:hypothetical protein
MAEMTQSVVVLPKSFDLSEPIETLPPGTNSKLISVRPISGGTFTQNQIIECDLLSQGWLQPESLSIRYKMRVNTDATGAALIGVPVFTAFNRLSCSINSVVIDSISNYNQVMSLYVAGNLSIADRYGAQAMYGFSNPDPSGNTGNMEYLDGRAFDPSIVDASANSTFTMAAPLYGTLLSSASKNIPLFALPTIRFSFNLDSIANMSFIKSGAAGVGYTAFTKVEIFNFELCYNSIEIPGSERMVASLGRQVMIKSHGLNNSTINVPSGSSGSQSYVYNQRFQSIRNAFLLPTRADGNGNKWAEICDLTNGNGSYQLSIAGTPYPPQPLSTALNNNGVLCETRRAFGSLFDNKNSLSINTAEFSKDINDAANTLFYYQPGKAIVGICLSKVGVGDSVQMAGVSTANSAITANVELQTATSVAASLSLVLDYDALLVIDPLARQIAIRS